MNDINEKYKTFQLEERLREHLLGLSDYKFPLHQSRKRIVVETLVVENGDRKIVRQEEKGA